jgi:hypothetical protein
VLVYKRKTQPKETMNEDPTKGVAWALFVMCFGYPALLAGVLVAISLLASIYS